MIDILIVGAGPSGLCAAKTFLEYSRDADVVLLDAHSSLGGVWAKEKLYPTMNTNNLKGTMDFSDFEMDGRFGVAPGQHVPGEVMNAYLCAYASQFDLTRRVRFNTRVIAIRRHTDGDGWALTTENPQTGTTALQCRKLVVATGILSVPHLPDLKGAGDFDGRILHSSELGLASGALVGGPDVKTIAVVGGGKSAYDAVYLAASTGHKVEWIIRRSGRGPVWVFPPHTYLGPFKAWREMLITRRIFSFMSPCIWPDFSGLAWLRDLLHFNTVGKFISRTFWKLIHADTLRDCGYRTDPKLNILEPEQSPFWYGTASGTINYDQDFFSYIRNDLVKIHREDISHLSSHAIHLADGTILGADAIVSCTGFSPKPTIIFEPASIHSDIGTPSTQLDQSQQSLWGQVDAQADVKIGTQFPRLLTGPFQSPGSSSPKPFNPGMAAEVPYTPWRLYRGIAPPGLTAAGDRSLIFLGMCSNVTNTIRLEIQCLWALAYLNGKLAGVDQHVRKGKVFEETAMFQRYTQHRAPYGHGAFYPDLSFDQLPYWDILLNDLGLPTARKGNMARELFEAYTQDDYRGLVQEWKRKNS